MRLKYFQLHNRHDVEDCACSFFLVPVQTRFHSSLLFAPFLGHDSTISTPVKPTIVPQCAARFCMHRGLGQCVFEVFIQCGLSRDACGSMFTCARFVSEVVFIRFLGRQVLAPQTNYNQHARASTAETIRNALATNQNKHTTGTANRTPQPTHRSICRKPTHATKKLTNDMLHQPQTNGADSNQPATTNGQSATPNQQIKINISKHIATNKLQPTCPSAHTRSNEPEPTKRTERLRKNAHCPYSRTIRIQSISAGRSKNRNR